MLSLLMLVGMDSLVSPVNSRISLSGLWSQPSSGPIMHRRSENCDVYTDALEDFRYGSKRLVMLEIGRSSEESTLLWVNWFKDVEEFIYVGLNDDPQNAMHVGKSDSIHIEAGSQADIPFLNSLCTKYGSFDIIIDNGNQTANMMAASLMALFPCMSDHGFYFMEGTSLATKDTGSHQTISPYLSEIYASMHYYWTKNDRWWAPIFSGRVKSIQLMDGLVVLERAPTKKYEAIARGTERIPYSSVADMQVSLGNNQVLNVYVKVAEHSSNIPHENIKEDFRIICKEYPILIKPDETLEDCARYLKQNAILKVFGSKEDYLYGDEPIPKDTQLTYILDQL